MLPKLFGSGLGLAEIVEGLGWIVLALIEAWLRWRTRRAILAPTTMRVWSLGLQLLLALGLYLVIAAVNATAAALFAGLCLIGLGLGEAWMRVRASRARLAPVEARVWSTDARWLIAMGIFIVIAATGQITTVLPPLLAVETLSYFVACILIIGVFGRRQDG